MDDSALEKSCEEIHETHPATGRDAHYWDGRASEFSEHATTTGYAERFLALMDIDPNWLSTCGFSILAAPFSHC